MNLNAGSSAIAFLLKRKWIILSLCLVTPAGFLSKFYAGIGHKWFNNYGAGLLYELFWCLVVFFFIPRRKYITRIALWIFIITCILEILQLWHPPLLEQIRSTFLGAAFIGTTFVWWDFPHYAIGCAAGWVWMRAISEGKHYD